jgi:dTDP-4-dehydrorhamnose reductase
MNTHKNARTTPHSPLLMVRRTLDQRQPAAKVAADFGVSERTVRKWLARWRAGGVPAINDRSSAPARQRRPRASVLECARFDRTFALPRRPWTERLDGVVRRLLADPPPVPTGAAGAP